ncbi:unnamed protein product, partial [Discosporangium mesarthrocarpum]
GDILVSGFVGPLYSGTTAHDVEAACKVLPQTSTVLHEFVRLSFFLQRVLGPMAYLPTTCKSLRPCILQLLSMPHLSRLLALSMSTPVDGVCETVGPPHLWGLSYDGWGWGKG